MVVHPSTGHQNPSYLPPSPPIYFHLIFSPISPSQSSYTLHIYFLILHPSPNFLLLKNFFISYYFQFNTIRKKIFFYPTLCQPKSQESSIIAHL